MRGTMTQDIEAKLRELSHKRALFNQALKSFQSHYYNNHILNQYTLEQQKAINSIITNLNWIKESVDRLSINSINKTISKETIETYIEIADHGLKFCLQHEANYHRFYQNSPRDKLVIAIKRLGSGFDILLLIEKVLLIPTLLFAASPMLMLSLFPGLFGEAMMFISPLLLILPPLTYTVCAIGALLLGVKLIQMGLQYYSKKDNVRALSDLNNIKHEAAEKLLQSDRAMDKLKTIQKDALLSTRNLDNNPIDQDDTLLLIRR